MVQFEPPLYFLCLCTMVTVSWCVCVQHWRILTKMENTRYGHHWRIPDICWYDSLLPLSPSPSPSLPPTSLLQLVVGDLGSGQFDMKLKVYKGTAAIEGLRTMVG